MISRIFYAIPPSAGDYQAQDAQGENHGRVRAPEDILISFPNRSSLQQSEKSESNLMSNAGRKR